MLFSDRLSDCPGDCFDRDIPAVPLHLRHHDEPFVPVALHGKCRAAGGPKRRMASLDGLLDVLRVNVATAENDQVLDPAGDVQLAAVEKTEIARPEERAVPVGG